MASPMETKSRGDGGRSADFSAQPSCGKERREEIRNLPQMEPLCPVTCGRSAGS